VLCCRRRSRRLLSSDRVHPPSGSCQSSTTLTLWLCLYTKSPRYTTQQGIKVTYTLPCLSSRLPTFKEIWRSSADSFPYRTAININCAESPIPQYTNHTHIHIHSCTRTCTCTAPLHSIHRSPWFPSTINHTKGSITRTVRYIPLVPPTTIDNAICLSYWNVRHHLFLFLHLHSTSATPLSSTSHLVYKEGNKGDTYSGWP
jgi:hypothetical protein